MRKILFFTFIFYILVLLQTSFLIYFNLNGFIPNLILIAIILINLFEEREKTPGIYSALIGGFFLDIFSENFFGFYILISIIIAVFIKFILKRYVRTPSFKRI